MPLTPQAVAYLDELRAVGAPDPWELPVKVWRFGYNGGAAALFGPLDAVASVEDLDAGGVPVRVYRPSGGALPALVFYHGGGWVLGGLESHDPLCRALAARSGCAVVAVDYRLAPEHPYPAAVDDAWAAVTWAADRFSRVAVAGDSAGGQLAAAVALRARNAGVALALQVLIYPVTDFGFDTESHRQNVDGPSLTADHMRWFWGHYLTDETRAGEADCSPLRAADVGGLAPALVLTAEYDPVRDEAEAYADRMLTAGVPVTLKRYDGLIHGFIRMPAVFDEASGAIDQVAATVRSALLADPVSESVTSESRLAAFNALDSAEAERALLQCASSARWATLVAGGRPYRSLDDLMRESERAFDALGHDDWRETFAGHARIGEPRHGDALGASEQAGIDGAQARELAELRAGNASYEARFGRVFLICASGLSAGQMLGALRERIDNPPDVEFTIATGELRKITGLRLHGMMSE